MIYSNIIYREDWCGPYAQLCEAVFLDRIFKEVKDLMNDTFWQFEFYVYSSNGDVNPPKPIVLTNNKPKILIYISDEHSTIPRYLGDYFIAIFKAHLPGSFEEYKLYPFPLGYHQDVPLLPMHSISARENNVFFSGNLNFNRIYFYKELSLFRLIPSIFYERLIFRIKNWIPKDLSKSFNRSYIQFTDGFKKGIGGTDYATYLHNSKIAICPPGFRSPETFRHFEAMRAGCIIITTELPDTAFYKNSPMVVLKNWTELRITINKLLKNPQRMEDIHVQTLDWWEKVCSEDAVANYIVDKIKHLTIGRPIPQP